MQGILYRSGQSPMWALFLLPGTQTDQDMSIYCSLTTTQCIRESLAVKQECPTCRKGQENEGHIRVNPVLDEAVAAWGEARCVAISAFTIESFDNITQRASVLSYIEKANRQATVPSTSSPKKRKRSAPNPDSSDIEIVSSPPRASSSKPKRGSTPTARSPRLTFSH